MTRLEAGGVPGLACLRAAVNAVRGRAALRLKPSSALIVPVLDAEPVVAAWLQRPHVDFDGAPLHVTVMFPFLPVRRLGADVEEAVTALACETEPFRFSLTHLDTFPGVHYLAPRPAEPFVDITERITRRWPSCLPYEGVFDAVIPHVAVAFGEPSPADPAALTRALPITTAATEFWLIEQTPHGWRTRRRFPLGRSSAVGHDDGRGADMAAS
ncbi:MAG: 2'-5' RNA ligase family protein [Sciscionella sp.]